MFFVSWAWLGARAMTIQMYQNLVVEYHMPPELVYAHWYMRVMVQYLG